jgi:aryl-alcohol dehydrogenase-like predicted oxidoreductase
VIPRHAFADGYSISRLIKGGWHLAGDHGPVQPAQAVEDMARFVEAGITAFDCAGKIARLAVTNFDTPHLEDHR